MKVNEKRLLEEFLELTAIDSVSFEERQMADILLKKLQELGFEVMEDETGESAGNVYGFLKGTVPGPGILLSAHMDTVQPGKGKKPVVAEDRITSDGTTVLGADDVSGIVEILEAVRMIQEAKVPHRDVEVLFPFAEEAYVKGSAQFDYSKVKAKEAYVLDSSGPVGAAVLQEPTLISFCVAVKGKASHAGFAPEQGVNAILAAANAVSRIRQGRIGKDSTVNIGMISGGTATNIVAEECICRGEIRSNIHETALELLKEVENVFLTEAQKFGAEAKLDYEINLVAYKVSEDAPVVQHFKAACEKIGIEPKLSVSFGGSDNNSFARNGIPGVVLTCGMQNIHTTKEFIMLSDLRKGAELTASLIGEV